MRRRFRSQNAQPLRAGMPLAVIAEEGARGRVIGFVALRAIARVAAALDHGDLGTGSIAGVVAVIVVGVAGVVIMG